MTTEKNNEWGDIPQGWEVVALGDVCHSFKTGKLDANAMIDNGAYPFFTCAKKIYRIDTYAFDVEALLISGNGANVGYIHYYNGKFNAYQRTYVLSDFSKNIIFIKYYLEKELSNRIEIEMRAGNTPYITMDTLTDMMILVPKSLTEQTAIATVLSDTDKLINSLTALIAKKQAIKSATMSQLLSGQKRLSEFANHSDGTPKTYIQTDNGKIPEDWEVLKVSDIGYVGRGRVISHNEINHSISDLYPVYSSQTTNDGIMGYLDTFDFSGEYVTWTTDGVNAGKVFYRNGKFNCTNVCGTIKVKENYCAKFIALAMGKEARKYVSTNLANPKLMNGVAKSIQMAIPKSTTEQTAIAQILSDMDSEIIALENRLNKTKALKQGLMHQLLTGKIRLVKN